MTMNAVRKATGSNYLKTAMIAGIGGAATYYLGLTTIQTVQNDSQQPIKRRPSLEAMYGTADGNFPSATKGARLSNAPGVKEPRLAHSYNRVDNGVVLRRHTFSRNGEAVLTKPTKSISSSADDGASGIRYQRRLTSLQKAGVALGFP